MSKKTKKPKKVGSPLFGAKAVGDKLNGFKTAVQLAEELGVTKTTAQVYLKKLRKTRKIETKLIRQGKRGPLAIAFRCVRGKGAPAEAAA